ncbi:hypothetical protein HK100_008489 [Physocladia obscura]|uniref:Uncharacterized protein n=1 Tax=Physocladia obscura TaxID=109957 RepID=A0AAD5XHZ0_9FUNG|nr:hypothetical protein HK100_008489 [Physocladia obscura]
MFGIIFVLAVAVKIAVEAGNTRTTASITETSTSGSNTTSITVTSSSTCVTNSSAEPGSIYMLSPTSNDLDTSAAVVGGKLNFTWSYGSGTTTPKLINLYWALIPTSNDLTTVSEVTAATYYENTPVATNISGLSMSYMWTVTGLQPGNYKFRIVADGIDLAYYTLEHTGEVQCYKSGQAFPATSTESYVIAGNSQLVQYPNKFAANSAISIFSSTKRETWKERKERFAAKKLRSGKLKD